MLSPDELERYARHIVLREVGGPGQQQLKASRVLVIGAGGLGSPLILYLAAAGVGTIGLVDDDDVSLSNLQRQILHTTAQVGQSKLDSASDAVMQLNPHVRLVPHRLRLTVNNAAELVTDYSIVADGSDNFETRYAVADACALLQRPLITAAVNRFDGSLTTLKPWTEMPDGKAAPRYRDLFPDIPPPGTIPTCAEAGILGALTGVMGTLMAMEAIKELLGLGEGLVGKLLLYDALRCRFDTIAYGR